MEHNRVIYERPIYDSEIEYIQNSNSFEAIDSLITVPANATSLKIEAKFCFVNHNNYQVLCGHQNDGFTTPALYLFYSQNTTVKTFAIGSTTIRTHELDVDLPDNFIFDGSFTMQNGIATVYGNNGSINKSATYNNNLWKGGSYSLIVMGGRVGASHIGEDTGIMKLYKFSITLDNVLVRDFIPVRVGQTGYLYDKVSHKLFGAISGNFILGPDVTNPVPNIRRVFRFGNKRFVMPMPYDSKIEYLESGGTQWIDTGYVANKNTEINAEFSLNNKNTFALYGRSNTINDSGIRFFASTKLYINHGGSRIEQSNNLQINTRYTVVHKHNSITLNNVAYRTGSGESYPNVTFSIFRESGVPTNQTIYLLKGKIYFFHIFENGTLIRSFIPVRRGNVGYLYDKVSGKLFGNAGTGQFILGNDIN